MTPTITENQPIAAEEPDATPLESRAVRSGLIVATLARTASGEEIRAPLTFDEAIVVEEGRWPLLPGEAVDDALVRVYVAHFDAWCARSDAERKAAADEERRFQGPRRAVKRHALIPMHTPCPVLWAGR